MSFFIDRVVFNAVSGGTGTFSVGAAVAGYQLPATAGAVSGQTYSYAAQLANLSQWEVGYGAYTAGSPATLARTTVLFNSAGGTTAISFSSAPQVMVTLLGEDVRTKITADINFYVSTTGSNSNNGLSTGSAFATIQFALDYVRQRYDLSTFQCFVNVDTGSYVGPSLLGGFVGGRLVEITGAGSGSTTVDALSIGSTAVTVPSIALSPVLGVNALSLGPVDSTAMGIVNLGYRSQKTGSDLIIVGDGFSIGVQTLGLGVFVAVQANFTGGFFSLFDLDQNSQILAHNCQVDGSVTVSVAVVTNDANALFINDGSGGTPAVNTSRFYAIGACVMRGTSSNATDIPGDRDGYLQIGSNYTALTVTQVVTPASGDTVSMRHLRPLLLINTALLATLTVVLPVKPSWVSAPYDGLVVTISAIGGVTALTVSSTDGTTVRNPPTTLAAGSSVSMIYHTTTTSWFRCI